MRRLLWSAVVSFQEDSVREWGRPKGGATVLVAMDFASKIQRLIWRRQLISLKWARHASTQEIQDRIERIERRLDKK